MTRAIDRLIVSGSIDSRRGAPTSGRRSAGCSAGSTAATSSSGPTDGPVELEREGARVLVRLDRGDRRGRARANAAGDDEPGRSPASWRSSPPARRRRCRRSRRCWRRSRRCRSRRCTTCAGSPTARSRSSSAARTATTRSGSPGCARRTRTEPSPAGRAAATEIGDAVHRLLELVDLAVPGAARRRAGARRGIPAVTDEELERIAGFVEAYCGSELARRIAGASGGAAGAAVRVRARRRPPARPARRAPPRRAARARPRLQDELARRGPTRGDRRGGLPAAAARLRARVLPGRARRRSRSSTTSSSGRTRSSRRRSRPDDVPGARGRAVGGDRADPRRRVPADAERVRLLGLPGPRRRLRRGRGCASRPPELAAVS